ncbi:hypothetical protein HOD20_08830 [archaeon]|jgi:DNA replicative helicase MCM subunit Mcm2 (Cdc46/Mcm family)|nr:hypothetical protein [archaeon]MBT4352613.1 hypothetical protein [archaeon]MBT4648244.1 hypothetical protein [archaeon]MBT6820875.1 hypothetical protein [archaeon]MBT7392728.1 hypothetical protein [archaeon]
MILDLFRLLFPLTEQKKKKLDDASFFIDEDDAKQLKLFYKLKKVNIIHTRVGVSGKIMDDIFYPTISTKSKDEDIKKFVVQQNKIIFDRFQLKAFKRFSKVAYDRLQNFIAPNIYGLEHVKNAVMLQLFSTEIIHILLLGDPGTGKTKIIQSASVLHPHSIFGLGSGISGAGLGLSMKGNEIKKGLLPLADQGLCCIDELNLIKSTEYGYLYSAMEDGFVSYDKANKHIKVDARIRVLSTANPKGDKFVGKIYDTLKKQIPFNQALLSRFHLIFIIRKLDVDGFVHVAKKIMKNDDTKILKEDKKFINDYISYCEKINVKFPKELESKILDFAKKIKQKESKYLFEITPRTIVGLIRMCKARARIDMRNKVIKEDIDQISQLVENCYLVRE